jgi:chromosome segregation ATPase
MSVIAEIIDTLEDKVERLILKIKHLDRKKQELKIELTKSANIIQVQTNEIRALKAQYETLKIANTLLGGGDNKRDTKLKINSLIREIDYCVAQLSDL